MPAEKADADGVGVVPQNVCARTLNRAALGHGAVSVDHEVIAQVRPAVEVHMPTAHLGHLCLRALAFAPIRLRGCCMNDNAVNLSHDCISSSVLPMMLASVPAILPAVLCHVSALKVPREK